MFGNNAVSVSQEQLNAMMQQLMQGSSPNQSPILQQLMAAMSRYAPPSSDDGYQEEQQMPQMTQLTSAENADIAQLESMGYSRNRCLEAYFASDKNIERAGNLLLNDGLN